MTSDVLQEKTLSRILVIDDNPAIHADFRKVLESTEADDALSDLSAELFGVPVSSPEIKPRFLLDAAQQGEEGLEKLKQALSDGSPFSLAFVDMRMPPGWDGLETIEHLWQVDPQLHVVICTAYADYSWSDVVERLGANDRWLVLKKPFDNAEVCQMASALVEKRRLSEKLRAHLGELEDRLDEGTIALKEREQRLRNILDTAPDGIITFDAEGNIESVNNAACELFGFEAKDVLGTRVQALLHDQNACAAANVRDAFKLTESRKTASIELDSTRVNRSVFPAQWTVGHFRSSERQFFIAIVRDLTEHRQLQCNLAQAQKLESVGQLAAGIAHEINTPTQYVGDNVRFLRDSFEDLTLALDKLQSLHSACETTNYLPDLVKDIRKVLEDSDIDFILSEAPDTFSQTLDGIARVASIVQAMKEFSHPGDEEKTLVDIHAALTTSITVSRNEWKYVADVQTDFTAEMPRIPCLVGKLNQVFLNLIVNAAHAIADANGKQSKKKGTISIQTSYGDGWAQIDFTDTGTGIPAEIQGRIFDPFFTTKGVGKGTGQGLAIARSVVVDKHGGTIEVFTAQGRGTTFRIRLPVESTDRRPRGMRA